MANDSSERLTPAVIDAALAHPAVLQRITTSRALTQLREALATIEEMQQALRPFAAIEVPDGASDGTWVAKTIFCNNQVTAASVRAACAVVDQGGRSIRGEDQANAGAVSESAVRDLREVAELRELRRLNGVLHQTINDDRGRWEQERVHFVQRHSADVQLMEFNAGQNAALQILLTDAKQQHAADAALIARLAEHLQAVTIAPSGASICACSGASQRAAGTCWYCVARALVAAGQEKKS